ncbi:MAG: hypothetical protein K2K24_04390, partial [Clostridia bacterium]|nr:hypothetical protein [Clostridia bacterium]
MSQTKVRTSKFLITLIVLLIVFASFGLSTGDYLIARADTLNQDTNLFEEKIYTQSEIDDDFEEDSLLVVMDKYNSRINKKQDDIFSDIPLVESVKDLTSITGDIESKKYLNKDSFRQILKVSIKEKSKQNVLDTISQIEKIDGVLWAGVSGYGTYSEDATAISSIRYLAQWGLRSEYGINVEEAWKYSTGSKSVRVGVIYSGIADHDDLRANVV